MSQIGALIDYLGGSGELDNTIILLLSDNGASAEGGVEGSANEHKFSAGIREVLADNLEHYDDWGGPQAYSHYSWSWAWASITGKARWQNPAKRLATTRHLSEQAVREKPTGLYCRFPTRYGSGDPS